MRFTNTRHYDPANLLADGAESTATSYTTTTVDSVAKVWDAIGALGTKLKLNVAIHAISAALAETYGFKLENSSVIDFASDVSVLYSQAVDKETPIGYLSEIIVFQPEKQYVRLQLIGAETPIWKVHAFISPI